MNKNKISLSIQTIDSFTGDVATCECGFSAMGIDRMDAMRNAIRHECAE